MVKIENENDISRPFGKHQCILQFQKVISQFLFTLNDFQKLLITTHKAKNRHIRLTAII